MESESRNMIDIITQRKKIAELIIDILSEEVKIQDAIKNFPQEVKDESAECAFHAILHYEADEDYRKKESEYAEEQLEYLEYIADILKEGQSIPLNIIEEYKKYYENTPKISKKGIIYLIKNLFRLTI